MLTACGTSPLLMVALGATTRECGYQGEVWRRRSEVGRTILRVYHISAQY